MAKQLRLGFIGCGSLGKTHSEAVKATANIQHVAYCDLRKERSKELAAQFGGEAFTDPEKMAATMDLDAVWICLPPFAHGEAEAAAIAHQVPFFVEKPVGLDVKLTAKLAATVAKTGLITCAGYMNRYRKSADAARKVLLADPAAYAAGGWLGGPPPPKPDPNTIIGWWVQKDKSGGQFTEQVTHTIDLARYLMGDAASVSAYAAHGFVKGVNKYSIDDALAVAVQFKSGAVANFCASVACAARGGIFLDLYARNVAVAFSGWSHDAEIYTAGKKKPQAVAGVAASAPDIFAVEDAAFLKAVRTGNPAGIKTTYGDALKTLELTVAATESAAKGGKAIALKY
ncbi:MAG TPA: Gfo/Idh/MocA family oxidoreductase [Armatimonadota bacterium]|jgi:predicted dehydrogenase